MPLLSTDLDDRQTQLPYQRNWTLFHISHFLLAIRWLKFCWGLDFRNWFSKDSCVKGRVGVATHGWLLRTEVLLICAIDLSDELLGCQSGDARLNKRRNTNFMSWLATLLRPVQHLERFWSRIKKNFLSVIYVAQRDKVGRVDKRAVKLVFQGGRDLTA